VGRDSANRGAGKFNAASHHDSRVGFYIDPAFTQSAAGNLMRDLGFNGTLQESCLRTEQESAGERAGNRMRLHRWATLLNNFFENFAARFPEKQSEEG
jgi:hypothetical protein